MDIVLLDALKVRHLEIKKENAWMESYSLPKEEVTKRGGKAKRKVLE